MALYGRQQLDGDLRVIEETRHLAREALLQWCADGTGGMYPFKFKLVMQRLDREEERLKGKLAATRGILGAKEIQRAQENSHNNTYRANCGEAMMHGMAHDRPNLHRAIRTIKGQD